MALLWRRMKVLVTVVMVNLFIFILISRNNGQEKGDPNKVHLPTKPFWSKVVPNQAYWNLQQQVLDLQNNPILTANYSTDDLPHWLNDTALTSDPCHADFKVTTQVKDYNSLPGRFKDFLVYMRCRSYPLLVDQPDLCMDPPFLLLAIKSLAPHFDRRQAIRESWGRSGVLANRTVKTVFLLGNTSEVDHHPDLSDMLRYESSRHHDIVQWDYRDSFFNLTVKEVLFLGWIETHCPGAQYIFKGDDDVFVNTYSILQFLGGLSAPKAKDLFVGDVITNAGPHRDKKVKYFIPESMYVGVYPPYAGGGGYLFYTRLMANLVWSWSRVIIVASVRVIASTLIAVASITLSIITSLIIIASVIEPVSSATLSPVLSSETTSTAPVAFVECAKVVLSRGQLNLDNTAKYFFVVKPVDGRSCRLLIIVCHCGFALAFASCFVLVDPYFGVVRLFVYFDDAN